VHRADGDELRCGDGELALGVAEPRLRFLALGPRELDLGWLIFFHDYFQRIALKYGHAGLPDFFRRADVESAYGDATGHVPRDLDWYLAYAALRQALTSIRVSLRAVHFGEREQPDDMNDLVADRPHLEGIIT